MNAQLAIRCPLIIGPPKTPFGPLEIPLIIGPPKILFQPPKSIFIVGPPKPHGYILRIAKQLTSNHVS